MEAKSLSMKYRSDQTHSTKDKHHPHTAINDTIWNDIVCHHTHKLPCYVYQWTQNTKHIKSTQPFYRSNILFIRSFGTCRIRRFLAVLRSFFHSSLLCTFSCHPSPPTIHPSSLTSSCHLFLGVHLNFFTPQNSYIIPFWEFYFLPFSVHDQTNIINLDLLSLLNSVALVRKRTIPTERPPPVGEVNANFCG